ncbi:MAG: M23 family metallopeptidase [Chitinophagales bacterium]|jgi:murein DD-endopeptidase MepM/ murein hydrolase activator NlpD|nr:M23 family metallopeptidase [Chitinophagales bacterium]
MSIKKLDWNKLKQRLKTIYRFQIVDEKTYDVKFVFELKPLNILIGIGLALAFFTVLNFLFIAYTPLKQYIPGYGSSSGNREIVNLSVKTEELGDKLKSNEKYLVNLKNILNDKVVVDEVKKDIKKIKIDTGILGQKTTDESKFVKNIESGLQNAELLENIQSSKNSIFNNLSIQKPVSGKIITGFDATKQQFGLTILAKKDEEVKAPLSGTVIADGILPNSNAYLIVQAENQIVYILKNNTKVLKKTGNFVQQGETIAIIAKQQNSNNYNCILELWYKGQAIDPLKFIKL